MVESLTVSNTIHSNADMQIDDWAKKFFIGCSMFILLLYQKDTLMILKIS